MKRVWNAPATGSGTPVSSGRFVRGQLCQRVEGPAATICPAPLKFAPPGPARRGPPGRYRFAADQRGHPGGVNAHAGHRGPRTAARATASCAGTRRPGRGGQFADRVPGDDGAGGDVQMLGGQQGGADHQRLGHRGVLDLVRLRGGAQPHKIPARTTLDHAATRCGDPSAPARAPACQGTGRLPRVRAARSPGLLNTLPARGRDAAVHEVRRCVLVDYLQSVRNQSITTGRGNGPADRPPCPLAAPAHPVDHRVRAR